MAIQPTTTRTAPFAQAAPLVNLPVEIIYKVLEQVHDIQAIMACGRTCKTWNILMQGDAKAFQCFWKYLLERDFSQEAETEKTSNFQEAYKKHHGICSNLSNGVYDLQTLNGHVRFVRALGYADGKLFSSSDDGIVKIWDLHTSTCTHEFEGCTDCSRLLYAEGKIVCAAHDPKIKIWDLKTNRCLYTLIQGNDESVISLLYAEEKLFSGSFGGMIKVWDLGAGTCLHTLKGHTWPVFLLCFAEGKLISGSDDHTIKIWDLKTGICLHTFNEHKGYVRNLTYAGGKLISGSYDNTIKIWDLKANECLHTLIGNTCRHDIFCKGMGDLIIVGGRLISGSHGDGAIRIWDLETGLPLHSLQGDGEDDVVVETNPVFCVPGPKGGVKSLHFVEGRLISVSYDRTIKVWDLKTNTCLHSFKGEPCWTKNLFVEGKLVTAPDYSTSIKIWDFNPELEMTVRFDAKYGNSLVLCGEGGGLSWNPSEGMPLKCEGKDRWTISIPKGAREFKLVWKKKEGTYVWERGRNRRIEGSSAVNVTHIKFNKGK